MKKESNNVILANGLFPSGRRCLEILESAHKIICCDGAADKLIEHGLSPYMIIGDLDSLSKGARAAYASVLIQEDDQESNDLTKAVRYCMEQGYPSVSILGATGLREDHTLGNISLMLEHFPAIEVRVISDFGMFFLVHNGERIDSCAGERISIFSVDNSLRVSASGLRYPLNDLQLSNWYRASLNEATGDHFILNFQSDLPLIVYKAW